MDLDNWPWTEDEKKELEEIENYRSRPKLETPPEYFVCMKPSGRRLTADDFRKWVELIDQTAPILHRDNH